MADEKWYNDMDEGIHKNLETFDNAEALANAYVETKKLVGNSIRIPGEDAGEEAMKEYYDKIVAKAPNLMLKPDYDKEEQVSEFYQTLGRPEKAEGYELKSPEGQEIDQERLTQIQEMAFKSGLSKRQAVSFAKGMFEQEKTQSDTDAHTFEKDTNALKKEWGSAYDEKLDKSMAVLNKFFGDIFTKETIPAGFAIGLDKLSAQFGKEDVNFDPAKNTNTLTPEEANTAISEIYSNAKHAFFDISNPGHKQAMERMVALQQLANPE